MSGVADPGFDGFELGVLEQWSVFLQKSGREYQAISIL